MFVQSKRAFLRTGLRTKRAGGIPRPSASMLHYAVIVGSQLILNGVVVIEESLGEAREEVRVVYAEFFCDAAVIGIQHIHRRPELVRLAVELSVQRLCLCQHFDIAQK